MAVLEALGNGVLFGLLLAILIGPVFFALIQTSIEKGFSSGVGMAVGIAISDSMYVLIASLSVAALSNSQNFQIWLGLLGGFILVGFGLVNFFKKVKEDPSLKTVRGGAGNWIRQVGKGFLLNGINPFVFLFWVGIASMVTLNFQYSMEMKVLFYCAIILTVLLLDFVKAFAANKLRALLSPRFLNWMNRIVGLALVLFSLRLFYFALQAMEAS